jgi:hypothetical protein
MFEKIYISQQPPVDLSSGSDIQGSVDVDMLDRVDVPGSYMTRSELVLGTDIVNHGLTVFQLASGVTIH